MPLVTETDTTRWQNAIAKGRHLTATCVEGAGSDHQEWDVVSNSDPSRRYQVALHFSARGTEAGCTCEAARFDDVCCHVAGVLLRTGHIRWFDWIVGRRVMTRTPGGYRADNGQVVLVGPNGQWEYLSQIRPAHWGAGSGADGRWETARDLLRALSLPQDLNRDLTDWLSLQPFEGWEISAASLCRMLAGESLSVAGSAA